jgi:nucleotidyltransferase AbiEii toxin of type IV toxin-antitoxin system
LSAWRLLLSRTIQGLVALEARGQPAPEWVLGGGTALMLAAHHRLSRDIDAFIDDPQYLALLSPDLTDVWSCRSWDKAAHYLKLRYPEGEIDFIVTSSISNLSSSEQTIDLRATPIGKKIHCRASMLKPRDIFDIAVVYKTDHDRLLAHLPDIANKKNDLLRRLDSIRPDFLQAEIAELDIQPGWDNEQTNCLGIVRSIADLIPNS